MWRWDRRRKVGRKTLKAYPIGDFHVDIAEVGTEQGKLLMLVAIDRTSKFASVELHERIGRRTAADFLRRFIQAICKAWTDDPGRFRLSPDHLTSGLNSLVRLPQEDFCQVFSVPSSRKYQEHGGPSARDILDRLLEADNPAREREAFFKGQILFWLIGATDGHAKNFSLFLRPAGRFELTPF